MSPEAMLLSALSAVTAALIFISRLLWTKAEECEKDRHQFRTDIATLQNEYLVYVKSNSEALSKITVNNTLAFQENTKALQELTRKQQHENLLEQSQK
jgi:hypothetical protein